MLGPCNQALFQLNQLTGLIDAWIPQLPAASYAKAGAELGGHAFPEAAPNLGQELW